MPRAYSYSANPKDDVRVGFNLAKRGNHPTYCVYFRGPDGRRLERDTGQTGKKRADTDARAIIAAEYRTRDDDVEKVSWDEARGRLEKRMTAAGLRPRSVSYYMVQFDTIRAFFSVTAGPADISPGMAQAFADHLATGKGKGDRKRSAWTAATRINALSVVFGKWLCDGLEIIPDNPFADVEPPKRDKLTPKVPTGEQVEQFHQWLGERFPGWELPVLFFRAKQRAGCRLLDLCSVRSDQLRSGRLHFAADQLKGRKARSVPLPADLFDALKAIAGPVHLWQRYPAQLKAQLRARGWPTHQLRPSFNPARMAGWVMTLFADYHADHPLRPKITSHSFRRLAFTEAHQAGVPLDDAALAYGCNVTTIRNHYVVIDEEAVADSVFARMDARKG